ncbi:DHA2 family efflux MFS transporter permease subunit [Lentilactobacillus parakefiri]|uniref:Major facilitator superfamily transporter n=1 Tax=Lentilactobacillus parakefiri TaxID=152332 RepID=A0A224VBK1_9LACO|nr:DHA2 family efflux MFS transporter permease subunit [Lentilactobacillus parakefiri]KRL72610.1 hypothetical protein FD08_GL003618 [Lentilactobacillus parakefiri DSM 10551]PAL00774.1 MFS transporter [Lentilactobacillus parakefiri]TDG94697.1 hypothetical protein C5L28_000982 [Lentilactobacillus parakefiri]GAW72305.1 major facilitator superfamily transporter [Lentilactobacillus parakefiri]
MGIDVHGKKYNAGILLTITLVATFAGSLMQTSMATAIPSLMRAFKISLSTAQQATTWFLLVNGAIIPLSAYLATRIPTKWLNIGVYGCLLLGMLISFFTPASSANWWIFLVGRIVAAVAFGTMLPIIQSVIMNVFPVRQIPVAMGISGLVVGLAPALGPTPSGWILSRDHHILGLVISDSWRNIFLIPMIMIAIMLIFALYFMKDVIPNHKIKLDFPSLFLSFVGFTGFLLGLTNVADYGWTSIKYVILPIIIGIVLLTVFTLRQLKLKEPFLDVRVFAVKDFTIPTIAIIFVMMAMYGVEMMLPTYLQNALGLSPFHSGLTLLGGALFMGILSPVSGFLFNRVGVRRLTFVGFGLLAIGTLPFAFLTENTSQALIIVIYAIRMIGIALVMMPLTTSAMDAIPRELSSHASAANNTARQIGSSVAVALLSSVTQNIINHNMPDHLLKLQDPMLYAAKALSASIDGFRVSFAIGFLFAVLGLCFAFFIKNTKPVAEKGDQK